METQVIASARGKTVLAVLFFYLAHSYDILSSGQVSGEKAVKQQQGRSGVRQDWQDAPDMHL